VSLHLMKREIKGFGKNLIKKKSRKFGKNAIKI
jgi:hypothetical protein